jgi:hypothetical protein
LKASQSANRGEWPNCGSDIPEPRQNSAFAMRKLVRNSTEFLPLLLLQGAHVVGTASSGPLESVMEWYVICLSLQLAACLDSSRLRSHSSIFGSELPHLRTDSYASPPILTRRLMAFNSSNPFQYTAAECQKRNGNSDLQVEGELEACLASTVASPRSQVRQGQQFQVGANQRTHGNLFSFRTPRHHGMRARLARGSRKILKR